ncbi:hypothetical protein WDU94_010153, partial [Cyamophila willieti]
NHFFIFGRISLFNICSVESFLYLWPDQFVQWNHFFIFGRISLFNSLFSGIISLSLAGSFVKVESFLYLWPDQFVQWNHFFIFGRISLFN